MFLKRVEMENFKSFRRVDVPFEPGFTGITGPNGSGKSNISDAILFVLGTKSSKAIRAGRLGDLIHNGGRKGKAARECRVSLIFENTDRLIPLETDEVKLTRVVRRSRTNKDQTYSHYYVNDNPSSLTEFEDLLSHARISADGYNIVQQGDVTGIVTMSNTERRKILDEIAGITRFDAEIEASEKKRTDVDGNLDRTRLILREVGQQMKQLAREKDRAAEYKTLREDLEVLKAKLAKKRVLALEQELSNVHESIRSYQEEGQELHAKRDAVEAKVQELAAELAELDERMAEMGGEEARERQEELQELREQAATARQMRNHFADELSGVAEDQQAAEAAHAQADQALDRIVEERKEVAGAIEKWTEEKERIEGELEGVKARISDGSERSHDLQRELAQMKQSYETLQDERHDARIARDGLTERLERLRHEHAGAEEKLETARFESKDVQFAAKEAREAYEALIKTKESHNKQLFTEKKKQTELTEQLKALEPEVRKLQNEYSRAKAEMEAHEHVSGFSRGVDAVLSARDQGQLKGICGTIAELGTPQKGLETALEIAAGGALQAVVVESDAHASKAIEFLKANKLGRVTFLPLNKLKNNRPGGQALMASRDEDSIGFARDLIDHDERYAAAFSYVYRDTLIVETLTAARRLMGGVRLVTRDGELIDAGGAMTGGHIGKRRTKFGVKRKEELDKLGKELRAKVTEQEALAHEAQEVSEAVRTLHDKLREVEAELVKHETTRGERERQAKEADQRITQFEEQVEELAKAIAKAEGELEQAEAALAKAEGELGKLEGLRETKGKELLQSTQKALADQLEELRNERDGVMDTLRDLDARAQALEEKERLARERRDEFAQRVAEFEAKENEFEAEIEGYKAKEAELKERIEVLEELVGQHDSQVAELREGRDALLEAKYKRENEHSRVQDAIDANQDLVLQFKGRVPVVEQSLEEARDELGALTVDPPETVDEPQEELKGDIRRIEGRMQRLEPVNMRALEEYEEQERRKDELETELERLETEREKLIELSEALIGRKKDELMKVFHEINDNFKQTFSDLSGGGAASLALENEVDPFQGGLILKSQPVGKKVHRLEALSGGEKSLTALSFIFAVQRYAPSPFYVLDEVDMFLDGMNSELVATMVRKNADRAQFIMVSLRKVTLKMADHVYGVTMRDGVSQVLGTVNVEDMTNPEEIQPPADGDPQALGADDGGDDEADGQAKREAETALETPGDDGEHLHDEELEHAPIEASPDADGDDEPPEDDAVEQPLTEPQEAA